ncbi:hypothetical protein MRS60_05695 [Burkholderia pyrrocinia]|uniref:hypothetical protein n=1 Tax=Burkholderia pyrrocinia TaxID=60550 RepID=UPI001FB2BB39|nr:hypothetical protein [Burkholderia pyrrocinia]UOB56595.1 hypothetical protein MRS60_05695 [Burkholderia pyrrocinia]
MTSSQPPFSARLRGQHRQVDADFPASARSGLLHLLFDLVERGYLTDWTIVARELHRIGRLSVVEYIPSNVASLKQARIDAEAALGVLGWEKVYDFCERLHGYLPQEIGHEDSYGNYIVAMSRGDIQTYIATELQRLFLEEDLAYEFTEGTVRRRGRKHTVELATKSQVVLGDPRLLGARKHFDKSLQFFRHPTRPDYENAVKEAVCAVEAAGKALFPMAKASTLGDLVKWLGSTADVSVPKAICQTITGVYAFRSGGDGVGHGGANGGKATLEVTEYLLALCASQIIYLVDLENSMEVDIPF